MTVLEHTVLVLDRQATERAAVAFGQAAVGDRGLDASARGRGGGACSRRSIGRDRPGSAICILGEPELVDELAVCLGRLERIEVLALQVLDERELELVAVGELPDDGRDALQAGELGGPEPALAGDELVAVDGLGDEDRLEDAVLRDAAGERGELLRVEALARLMRVRPDARDRRCRWCRAGRARVAGSATRDPGPGPGGRSGRTVMTSTTSRVQPPSLVAACRGCRLGGRPACANSRRRAPR